MKVTVFLVNRNQLDFDDFDEASALALKESLEDGQQWLTFDMDGATVLVNADQIIRIDMETA